jgi:hypothetical protein
VNVTLPRGIDSVGHGSSGNLGSSSVACARVQASTIRGRPTPTCAWVPTIATASNIRAGTLPDRPSRTTVEKLIPLIPRPRCHLVRYHGVLGPAAEDRVRARCGELRGGRRQQASRHRYHRDAKRKSVTLLHDANRRSLPAGQRWLCKQASYWEVAVLFACWTRAASVRCTLSRTQRSAPHPQGTQLRSAARDTGTERRPLLHL